MNLQGGVLYCTHGKATDAQVSTWTHTQTLHTNGLQISAFAIAFWKEFIFMLCCFQVCLGVGGEERKDRGNSTKLLSALIISIQGLTVQDLILQ